MGIEPNSDRMWNAIGGIVIAGAIIGALTWLVVGKDGESGLMKSLGDQLTSFMDKGFASGNFSTVKP